MPRLKLSTNLSGFAFEDEGLATYLRGLLKEHGVEGDRLVLEITEQLAVRFAARTDKQIALLRELGCSLAIDDFGSGYSSFSYLKRLPVDYLKIDGSFIRGLARDRVDQAMVRMVAEVARAAGIETVAEYVTSAATFDLLAKYGIDYAQGYFIGRPSDAPQPMAAAPAVGRAGGLGKS
jgi:EAL domain-containing protein (putative c-di-GMP-specific phosphodiesterase class I)